MAQNSDPISKAKTSLRADPDFIRFVLAWDEVRPAPRLVPFREASPSDAERKRLERHVKREYKQNWRQVLGQIKSERKRERRIKLRQSFCSLEPSPPNPPHRRADLHPWLACFDLLNYFIECFAKQNGYPPKGPSRQKLEQLAAEIVFPSRKFASVAKSFSKRKHLFANIDVKARLAHLKGFYVAHRESIIMALKTGKPLYEVINERVEEAKRTGKPLHKVIKDPKTTTLAPWPRWEMRPPSETWVGRCPRCGTEYEFLRIPPIPDIRERHVPPRGTNWSVAYCTAKHKRGRICKGKIQFERKAG